jgi:hypothetical protein
VSPISKSNLNSCIHVSLKKFVESKIQALVELFNEKLKGRDAALALQAKEYERRLADLNNEYLRNNQRNAEFVSLEKFDSLLADFIKYREANDKLIVGKEKFENFEREFRQYKETNDKAVEAKAKSIAEAVEQKAAAATQAVDTKATAVKKEFDEYKTTQATAVALAAGSKAGVGRLGSVAIAVVGVVASLLWAASLAVNIYLATHATH